MTSPDQQDPTRRFSDRADHYLRYRPGYPPALLELFRRELDLGPRSVVADLGSGTGILTAMLLGQGCEVYAVEPNAAMRRVAEQDLGRLDRFHSLDGRAEATGLGPQSVDLVFAAQAFHWFRRTEARLEFARILRTGGHVVLVWNRRLTEGSTFLRAYEDLLRREAIDYAAVDHRQAAEASALADFFGIPGYRQASFPNEQVLDWDGLRGRLLSSSYVPGEDHPRHAAVIGEMQRIFTGTQEAGVVRIKYDTEVYWGSLKFTK